MGESTLKSGRPVRAVLPTVGGAGQPPERRKGLARHRSLVAATAFASAAAAAAPSVNAATFTFSKTTGGPFAWNNTTSDGTTPSVNWTPTTPAPGFPDAVADVANVNNAIA